jgi:SNF2 family DNA or RNA helicase
MNSPFHQPSLISVPVSSRHRLVLVPATPQLRGFFPTAQQITFTGNPTLLVPHEAAETLILRNAGFDVPAPILKHYSWPGRLKPFDVQKKTCAGLTLNPRFYVLNSMGTGKTRTILWSWDYLNSNNLAGKLLVVAPLSVLTSVWAREVFDTLPHRKVAVLHGDRAKRLKQLARADVDIYVINHDGLKIVLDELYKRPDINVLAIDELAVYRRSNTKRTRALMAFAKRTKWVWGLTGAPIPTSPTDVYSQALIVTPERVPQYFKWFRDELMYKVSEFRYVPKPDALDKAYKALQPAVRYTLDDVLELPPVVERIVEVEMSAEQRRIYNAMAHECYAMVENHEITAANAGANMSKLLQVASGWVYSGKRKEVVEIESPDRIERLVDDIESSADKVLVFAPFKHTLMGISQALFGAKIDHAVVSGDTPVKRRNEIFAAFQNTSRYKVIDAHPQCLAHGLTLTAATVIIWFAPIVSLEIYQQANARIRRIGQTKKQLLLHYQATPVERKIYALLRRNQTVQNKLLELFELTSD